MPSTHPARLVREKAQEFWDSLSPSQRWDIGDELVLGTFDWRDWLPSKPEPGFLNHVDYLRMLWEA